MVRTNQSDEVPRAKAEPKLSRQSPQAFNHSSSDRPTWLRFTNRMFCRIRIPS